MSIFKSTFSPHIQSQLESRRDAMLYRSPEQLSYLNSRNAWIRMSSSVNVNGTNELAKKYILQGGTLNDITEKSVIGTPKSGIGDFSNAYSNTGYNGNPYRLGIRPMPGITSLDIKSKSAYGSLREATINFQCWDINQLEDLELLYMRPGYTVLIEWGWTPYLDNSGKYEPNFTDYYDIINIKQTDRTKLFRDLYDKSVKYAGNYDAMFGYIKNYQWSARMDGGYDCQVSVISTGEIIESLKVNYLPAYITSGSNDGLLSKEFSSQGNSYTNWQNSYTKNTLAGVWAETYYKLSDPAVSLSSTSVFTSGSFSVFKNLKFNNSDNSNNKNSFSQNSNNTVYITLDAVLEILNKYIIAKSSTDNQPLVKFSLYASEYDGTPPNTDLYCIAHPLQISVDPSVCLIKNTNWSNIIKSIEETSVSSLNEELAINIWKDIKEAVEGPGTKEDVLLKAIKQLNNTSIYNVFKITLQNNPIRNITSNYKDFQDILNGELKGYLQKGLPIAKQIKEHLEKNVSGLKVTLTPSTTTIPVRVNPNKQYPINVTNTELDKIKEENSDYYTTGKEINFIVSSNDLESLKIDESNVPKDSSIPLLSIAQNSEQAIKNIEILKYLGRNYFWNDDPSKEIGILKNIYVNIDYLYQQALSSELEARDPKDKNEINLYNYIKRLIADIQASIGNINSFEIHVDPVDNNVARIIDINYTEPNKAKYSSLYELPIHSLDSTVRNYSLQSQIFPDQSSIIAIGAQAKGGQLGIQNNTMIDFNRKLTDRIIVDKIDAQGSDITPKPNDDKYKVTNGLSQIITLLDALNGNVTSNTTSTSADYNTLASDAKNALRDLIVYFQSITLSPGSNRNIIPTKFSAEMDGIGGLVIGHMFKLPDTVLPRGYRGIDGIGSQLGNVITSIGHSIQNGDWVTKIDSLNVVLNPYANADYQSFSVETLKSSIVEVIESVTPNIGGQAAISQKESNTWGKVDKSIPVYAAILLDLIATIEGTSKLGNNNGYDIGYPSYVALLNWNENYRYGHPGGNITGFGGGDLSIPNGGRKCAPSKKLNKDICSNAIGRYQFMQLPDTTTWTNINKTNVPMSKINQDKAGYKLLQQSAKENNMKNSYDLALQGVKDVTQNNYFLDMLGSDKGVSISSTWASIPNRYGRYRYSGQGSSKGIQDIYNIYLAIINSYNYTSNTGTPTKVGGGLIESPF